MTNPEIIAELCDEFASFDDIDLITTQSELVRFSKDFYDYSPVLAQRLKNCCSEIVVRPKSLEAVQLIASTCARKKVSLTIRGSGTGNYGQCVPLHGGVVMLMNSLSNIRHFDKETGVVTVEPGCLISDLERYLSLHGRQLRLMPSTWRSASIGGFLSGGSGGIGSVRWGFLRDPGHLLSLEIITLEPTPKKLKLNALEAEGLNHAYGTNGIITAITLCTSQAVSWQEVCIDSENWRSSVELLLSCSSSAIELNLCSLLEKNIVEQLPNWYNLPHGKNRLLFLVSPDGVSTLERLASDKGGTFRFLGLEKEQKGFGLRELSWNHTTLHLRAKDSSWTYLQMLLPQPELNALEELKARWGDSLLWHLESVRQNGSQRLAALPLIKWSGEKSLNEVIENCKDLGAIIFNPHVLTVEEGGLGIVDVDQVKAKKKYDPYGLMNPGKLKGWIE